MAVAAFSIVVVSLNRASHDATERRIDFAFKERIRTRSALGSQGTTLTGAA